MTRWAWVRETQTWHLEGDLLDYEHDPEDADKLLASRYSRYCDPNAPQLHVPNRPEFFSTTHDNNFPTPGLACAECASIVLGRTPLV